MLAETRYEHVVLNDAHIPLIAGTTMKVVELVLAQAAYGWSAEELHIQFSHLTLGQIYSALAYYWDHKAELTKISSDGFRLSISYSNQCPPRR